MKQPNPKCPYCGREMIPEYTPPEDHFFRCLYCKGVQSPTRCTPYEAWTAANNRPLQKPLTLKKLHALIDAGHEVVVYCETIKHAQTYANIIYNRKTIDRYGKGPGADDFRFDTYGITWRAWASRPTDEERAAAQWEE